MKKKVFISYSRIDMDFVKTLAEDLENQGFDIWYDLTDIDAGDRWAQEIQEGISESEIFAIVVSPNSLKSEWVEKEFLFASKRGLKIVPLLYEMCELPIWLMNIQYVDIVGRNYKRNFQQILDAFNDFGQREEDREDDTSRKEPRKVIEKSQIPWIVGGVIGVVAILAAIFWPRAAQPEPTEIPASETPTAVVIEVLPTETETPTATETEISPSSTSMPAGTATPIPAISRAEMIFIPAGSFLMGSDDGEKDEGPLHKVRLDAFYIDKYEVTNVQYKECVDDVGTSACDLPTNRRDYLDSKYSDHPVFFVDWDKAAAYCEWRGARLPTEAEWEKAARGTETANYPWGYGKLDAKKLNFCDMNCTNAWKDKTINDKYLGFNL